MNPQVDFAAATSRFVENERRENYSKGTSTSFLSQIDRASRADCNSKLSAWVESYLKTRFYPHAPLGGIFSLKLRIIPLRKIRCGKNKGTI